MIADAVDPSGNADALTGIGTAQFAAGMRTVHKKNLSVKIYVKLFVHHDNIAYKCAYFHNKVQKNGNFTKMNQDLFR